jgi:hypothetical protein
MQMRIIRLMTAAGAAAVLCVAASSVYVDRAYGGVVVVVPEPPLVVPVPVVPLPDVYFWGGPHERGRDVRDYSRRGHESRRAAHPVARGGRR